MSSFSSSGFPAHLFFWGCLANQLNSLDTGATALYVREAQRSGAYARTERNLVWRIAARNLVLRKGGIEAAEAIIRYIHSPIHSFTVWNNYLYFQIFQFIGGYRLYQAPARKRSSPFIFYTEMLKH